MSAASARAAKQSIAHQHSNEIARAARRFGVVSFRPGQHAIIEAVLDGRDVIGVLPAGGGKSLCYRLPALLLPKATVVVSSDIALDEGEEVCTDAAPLVYVTPERLQSEDCIRLLQRNGLSRLVIDDAHRVSDPSHDLWPAYLGVAHAAWRLGRPPVLALTTAADEETTRDVRTRLGMRAPLVVRVGSAGSDGAATRKEGGT